LGEHSPKWSHGLGDVRLRSPQQPQRPGGASAAVQDADRARRRHIGGPISGKPNGEKVGIDDFGSPSDGQYLRGLGCQGSHIG
jgi:hypothetical protein